MKRLKKLRLACLIFCLLTLLASCSIYNNDKTIFTEEIATEETTVEDTTAEETTLDGDYTAADVTDIPQTEVSDGATVLYSYTLQSSPGYYYAKNENPTTDDNENIILCAIYTCENGDATISDSAGSLLLIRDGGWRLFDALTGVATDVIINTDEEILDVRLAYDVNTKEITGFILINSQSKIAFYNIESETVYGGFEYDSMDTKTSGDYFVAYKETHKESFPEQYDSYILKISDGSLVGSVQSEYHTSNAGLCGGAGGDCIHQNLNPIGIAVDESYHSYYGNLINGDNATEFQAWIKDTDDRETRNIYNLINDLKIDRDYLEALNSLQSSCYYYFDYNTDILYGGDIAAADKYYSTAIERVDEYMIKYYLLKFKGELNSFIKNDSRYNEWLDTKKSADDWYYCKYNGNESYGVDGIFSGDFRQWSIAEAVEYFNIEQSVLEDIAAIADQAALYSCSINIAALYDSEAVNVVKDSIKTDKDDGFSVDPALLDTKFITFDRVKLELSWAYIQNSGEFIAN